LFSILRSLIGVKSAYKPDMSKKAVQDQYTRAVPAIIFSGREQSADRGPCAKGGRRGENETSFGEEN